MPACDLSIIIVSWNVRQLLCACLASIEAISEQAASQPSLRTFDPNEDGVRRTLEVIVVDNASSDGTPGEVALLFPWVRLIPSEHNLGFTKGNNVGFAASRGRFVYFLNPDTQLDGGAAIGADFPNAGPASGGNSLGILFGALERDPMVGVMGPQLRYGDGQRQESRRRFPTPWTGFFESTWLGRALPVNPWAARLHLADWPGDFRQDVDWVVGAAMLCRREALTELPPAPFSQEGQLATFTGPFDETFFMYSEETDLCRRVKLAGWRVVYAPEAIVIHHEGKSSEQATALRHIHFNTSKVRYWRKWFGPRWAEALRRYLLLEFCIQWLMEGVKWLAGSKRPLRRQRMGVYRRVVETGLR